MSSPSGGEKKQTNRVSHLSHAKQWQGADVTQIVWVMHPLLSRWVLADEPVGTGYSKTSQISVCYRAVVKRRIVPGLPTVVHVIHG